MRSDCCHAAHHACQDGEAMIWYACWAKPCFWAHGSYLDRLTATSCTDEFHCYSQPSSAFAGGPDHAAKLPGARCAANAYAVPHACPNLVGSCC